VEHLRRSCPPRETQEARADELGKWFADYMVDTGYFLDGGQIALLKQMIMLAFPLINRDGEHTEENIEKTILRFAAVANDYFLKSDPPKAEKAFRDTVVI